jgi:hypothetical protein
MGKLDWNRCRKFKGSEPAKGENPDRLARWADGILKRTGAHSLMTGATKKKAYAERQNAKRQAR